jgi:hypothetical protein
MHVLLLDLGSLRYEEKTPEQIVASSLSAAVPLRFFGTTEVIIAAWTDDWGVTAANIFMQYNAVAETPISQADLCVAGHLVVACRHVCVMEWEATSLRVQTRKDLLDQVMTVLGATEEDEFAVAYRHKIEFHKG